MNYYLEVLKKYTVFNGRARRSEYWFFVLFNIIIISLLSAIERILHLTIGTTGILGAIYMLAVFLPGLAVMVRRLHDTNRSGWWILIGAIPYIGSVVLVVFALFDSTPGTNAYGPNPKEATLATSSGTDQVPLSTSAPVFAQTPVSTQAQVSTSTSIPEVQPQSIEPSITDSDAR